MSKFYTYDRHAEEELSRHETAPAASKAARKLSVKRPGHDIAWGQVGSEKPIGFWHSMTVAEFRRMQQFEEL